MTQPPEISPPAQPRVPGEVTVPLKLRGDTISYAIQHLIHNVGANIYEPALDSWIQKYWAEYHKNVKGYGTFKQNSAGQWAGDISGTLTLIAAELLIPNQLHAFSRRVRKAVDPLYDTVAHWVLRDQHGQPDYEQQVEKWKTYQERNFARSVAVMLPVSIITNVAVQKKMHSESPIGVIIGSKLITSSLTTLAGLVLRFVLPTSTKRFDNLINDHIVMPLLENSGAEGLREPKVPQESKGPYTAKLLKKQQQPDLVPAR